MPWQYNFPKRECAEPEARPTHCHNCEAELCLGILGNLPLFLICLKCGADYFWCPSDEDIERATTKNLRLCPPGASAARHESESSKRIFTWATKADLTAKMVELINWADTRKLAYGPWYDGYWAAQDAVLKMLGAEPIE